MRQFSTCFATCATALLSGSAAGADVTASEVWDSWQEMMATGGNMTVALDREEVGSDRVTVEGATYTYTSGGDVTTVVIDRIDLVENGDGTVSLTMSETIPITIDAARGGLTELSVQQTGLQTTVSGTPEAMTYAVEADSYEVRTDRVLDAAGEPLDMMLRATLNGVSGGYDQVQGDPVGYDYGVTSDSTDLRIDFTDPETGDEVTFSGQIDGLGIEAEAEVPGNAGTADMPALIERGLTFTAGYGYDGAAYAISMNGEGARGDGAIGTGPGRLSLDMSQAGLTYATDVSDISVELQGTELPFPIRASVASYGTSVVLPVTPGDQPEPFELRANLQELVVGDAVWAAIDPQGMVPRDPASLTIDISGEAELEDSLFADTAQTQSGSPIGDLVSISVNDISLALAGAALKAVGAFTFDPDGPLASAEMGSPVGQATIDVTGANQLIDTAIAMGLVPQDQAMMGRMMLTMFARPVGEDALQSVIEVTPDGRILANGQQIR